MTGKIPKKLPRVGIDEYGRTPLHIAVAGRQLAEVVMLLDGGAQINAQDDNGMTPLHYAVLENFTELIELLLSRKADPNLVDRHGNGPLWVSVIKAGRGIEVIKKLLVAGADPNQVNAYGRSPRSLAHEIGHGLELLFS